MGTMLFDAAADSARGAVAGSGLGGLAPGEKVVDLFCGAGGWGEGAKLLGIPVDFAVNHWPVAIDTHRTNNPGTKHHLGDAWRARPREVVGRARVGLLLASAACTTHSRARGSAPVSKRVHMLGWCIARWMREVSPRLVLIENVPEWKDWGPLIPKRDSRGRPVKDAQGRAVMVQDPARKGKHYRALLRYMRKLGYAVEEFICDAPDFGEASRRRRLFIQARRDGLPIVWPEKTHGPTTTGKRVGQAGDERSARAKGAHGRRISVRPGRVSHVGGWVEGGSDGREAEGDCGVRGGAELTPHRSAAECIDWTDLGRSIFDREEGGRPLKPKTQARIAEGIRRYVIRDPAPFVLRVTHGGGEGKGWHVSPVDQPLPTQTTRQDFAFATPVMATTRNGEREGQALRCHPVGDPLMTVTGGAVQGVAVPILAPQNGGVYGQPLDEPGPTVTTKGHQALIAPVLTPAGGPSNQPHPADEPMRTLLGRESFGIATPVLAGAGGSAYAGKPTRVDGPMGTVKCDDRRAMATPVMSYMHHGGGQHSDARDPLHGITAQGTHAGLIVPLTTDYYGNASTAHPVDKPLGAVTTLDRHAAVNAVLSPGGWELALERGRRVARWLVEHLGDAVPICGETGLAYTVIDGVRRFFVDVLFRMLRPRELARAMGFPDSYVWPRTQRDTVRLIGNAVSVRTAAALLGACLPRGARGVVRRRAAS
jgi:DNA (cytosine-5)-methyltransferase 1